MTRLRERGHADAQGARARGARSVEGLAERSGGAPHPPLDVGEAGLERRGSEFFRLPSHEVRDLGVVLKVAVQFAVNLQQHLVHVGRSLESERGEAAADRGTVPAGMDPCARHGLLRAIGRLEP
jgi:hypothetical protein